MYASELLAEARLARSKSIRPTLWAPMSPITTEPLGRSGVLFRRPRNGSLGPLGRLGDSSRGRVPGVPVGGKYSLGDRLMLTPSGSLGTVRGQGGPSGSPAPESHGEVAMCLSGTVGSVLRSSERSRGLFVDPSWRQRVFRQRSTNHTRGFRGRGSSYC